MGVLVTMAVENMHGFLNPNDAVSISFWIISISMVAATVFFLMESTAVSSHWKTSMNVGALVTLVAQCIISTCENSGSSSTALPYSIVTSIGRSQFLCR